MPNDFLAIDHGTIMAIRPLTAQAQQWLDDNIAAEGWQWLGGPLCIDPRYAVPLIEGIEADGCAVGHAWPPFIQVLRITEDGLEEPLIVNLDHVACMTPIDRKLGSTRLHFSRQALDADRVKRWEAEAALPIAIPITMPWAEMVETLKRIKDLP